MPRQQTKKTYFSFVGGLNTEGGFLTFPPNMWKEGDNVIPQLDGSLHLRTAINYEDSFQLSSNLETTQEKETLAYGSWEWNNVLGNGGINYIVVQRGRFLRFYKNIAGATSTTEKASPFVIDLAAFKAPTYPYAIGTHQVHCSSANGKLIVTSIGTEPFIVEEKADQSAFVTTMLPLSFRDFEGVSSDPNLGANVDVQPSGYTDAHKYNLLNQGWRNVHIDSYKTSQGVYPSNAQQWFVGKDVDDNFSPALLVKHEFGKSRAPQGHFILNAFNRDRTTVSGVPSLTPEIEDYRPAGSEFFAGRAWFAGIQASQKLGSWVFFSQVGLSNEKYANCYQEADPTSEQISDLVDTDGGAIPIQGMGAFIKLVALDKSILVFADNGVWAISGTLDSGFTATQYEVKQISAVGAIGAKNIVKVENAVLYWSIEGIWSIAPGQTGVLESKNLTELTIATFFRAIKNAAKETATALYHAEDKKVYWLYLNAPNVDGTSDRYLKDRMIVLDTRIGAFYTHTIKQLAVNSPFVLDLIVTGGTQLVSTQFNVIENADNVVNQFNEQVVELLDVTTESSTVLKFLTLVPSGAAWTITWSEFEDGTNQAAKFKEWFAKDAVGIGYVGFILTGHDLGANQGGDRKLQANYITVLMKRTETGVDVGGNAINEASVKLTTRWNFADSAVSNKWSLTNELYRHRRVFIPLTLPAATYDDGFPVLVAKHKMRGRGNAFQMRFESTTGMDFKLIGWSIPVLSNVD